MGGGNPFRLNEKYFLNENKTMKILTSAKPEHFEEGL